MKTISLINSDLLILVDDEDWLLFALRTWYLCNGYARDNGDNTYMHKLLTVKLNFQIIDHIDRNKLNNQKFNLRAATRSDNEKNKSKRQTHCSSKYKGVSYNKLYRKWDSYIFVNNKIMRLGYFDKEEDAAKAYNEAAIKHFGAYACINTL
jgi:hypothetical protein